MEGLHYLVYYNSYGAVYFELVILIYTIYFSLKKPELYEETCGVNPATIDYLSNFKCYVIDYSQSILLTAVNTILPALFTKMIAYEGYL